MKRLFVAILAVALPLALSAQKKDKDMALVNKVAQWQIDNYGKELKKPRHDMDWTNGALYRGMLMWGEYAGYKPCEEFVMALGKKNAWGLRERVYHADDICAGHSYIQLYKKYGKPEMIAAVKERADYVIANPSEAPMNIKAPHGKDRWSWCDALFMAPPVYTMLSQVTGDDKYIKFMNEEFYDCYLALYDVRYKLWFRDGSFVTKREENGEPVFWGRGNGWVFAALPMLLETLPEEDLCYDFYMRMYKDMAAAVVKCQDNKGSWHASMLDLEAYPVPENSASGFFVYGLAWGVNNGILTDGIYEKAAKKGWTALKSHVADNGRLGYVQPIGASPKAVKPESTEVYGVGAFLCAATEMMKMK